MMPPPAYSQARLRARFHVQVEYEPPQIESTPAVVPIRALVRSVFKGRWRLRPLRPGREVRFSLRVYSDDDERPPPPGGEIPINRDTLLAGRYLEVFLNGRPPDCRVADSQFKVTEGITKTPVMNVPTRRQVAAEWAEFRGRR